MTEFGCETATRVLSVAYKEEAPRTSPKGAAGGRPAHGILSGFKPRGNGNSKQQSLSANSAAVAPPCRSNKDLALTGEQGCPQLRIPMQWYQTGIAKDETQSCEKEELD